MKVLGVIPARFASTRFPGKPLAMIAGRPMIHWVIEGAKRSRSLDRVLVATDDDRIASACKEVNCDFVITESSLPTGTDRIYAAIRNLDCDVVVNIQGDEPLIQGQTIDSLVQAFKVDSSIEMATLAHPFQSEEEFQSMNAVKVLLNAKDEAIYFSRFGIPFSRQSYLVGQEFSLRHIGMYAYSKEFLIKYCNQEISKLEQAESLEQLRAIHMGAKIKVIKVSEASLGVDIPEDLLKVEKILKQGGHHGS